MKREMRDKWVAALNSGKYEQTTEVMRSHENSFCCLGVLCDITDSSKWRRGAMDQGAYMYKFGPTMLEHSTSGCTVCWPETHGLSVAMAADLAKMNDHGALFSTIADYIKTNLDVED